MPILGSRRNQLETDSHYTEEQIEAVLAASGVEVVGETSHDFLCFCPFHGNRHTPSFSVSKGTGLFICFNGACARTGDLRQLVQSVTGEGTYAALRLIQESSAGHSMSLADRRLSRQRPPAHFPSEIIDRMVADLWSSPRALDYLVNVRGFRENTLREFKVGYSPKKDMIATPMYNEDGEPVGVIGRGLTQRSFKNSVNLPTSATLWNIHRAKNHETAVVVEANFDGMRVAQAGYPGVVACLGGHLSENHADQLARNFKQVIIMTDFDDREKYVYESCRKCRAAGMVVCVGHNPGRALGQEIATAMIRRSRPVKWAALGDGVVYPDGAKDAGDMSDEQIVQCLEGAVSNFTYRSWKIPS